jgi:acetyl esterase
MKKFFLLLIFTFSMVSLVCAQEISSVVKVYKTIDTTALQMQIYYPPDFREGEQRTAIVFFFGGGWRNGSVKQFEPHCQHLANNGIVAMTADYRVKSRQNTTPFDAIADAKSAMRWIRAHAKELGIDPDKVVAAGGSAGGHLAACTATLSEYNDPGDDLSVSAIPNAMILFNPVADATELSDHFGSVENAKKGSPLHHLHADLPPAIIFHGTKDTTVVPASVTAFQDKMLEFGNECELILFGGAGHGFFNYGREGGKYYERTVALMDVFLQDHDLLK